MEVVLCPEHGPRCHSFLCIPKHHTISKQVFSISMNLELHLDFPGWFHEGLKSKQLKTECFTSNKYPLFLYHPIITRTNAYSSIPDPTH